MSEVLFTPASLLDLLSQITELDDYEIGVDETEGSINIKIGPSVYQVATNSATEVEVDEEVVDTVDEVNEDTYQELTDSGEFQDVETVESGPIKELLKATLLGGLIKLSTKLLK